MYDLLENVILITSQMVLFPNFIKIPKCHFCKLQIIPNPEFLTKKALDKQK